MSKTSQRRHQDYLDGFSDGRSGYKNRRKNFTHSGSYHHGYGRGHDEWRRLNSGQSKRHSLLEAFINVLLGYGVAVASQIVIFPLFDVHISVAENMAIGGFFTVVSIVRSYALRRLFNWWGSL